MAKGSEGLVLCSFRGSMSAPSLVFKLWSPIRSRCSDVSALAPPGPTLTRLGHGSRAPHALQHLHHAFLPPTAQRHSTPATLHFLSTSAAAAP